MWFIGLEFQVTNNELVDLNLTDTIQSFTDLSKFENWQREKSLACSTVSGGSKQGLFWMCESCT